MADGRDDRVARGPKKGIALRSEYEGKFSGSDYRIIGSAINYGVDADVEQHGNRIPKAGKKLRGDTGCIIKEPLS